MDMLTANRKVLREAINQANLKACVVGLGYVGLPLCAILGEKGFRVLGVDKKPEVIEQCKKGRAPFHEKDLDERLLTLVRQGTADFSTDASAAVRCSDVIFATVGTPLHANKTIDTTGVEEASIAIGQALDKGKLVIFKSTVLVGGIRKIVKPILEKASGLFAERDFGLAFVPERTVEGKALEELPKLPKIVAGLGKRSRRAAQNVYKVIGGPIAPVSCLEVAEAAKLFDNIYRDVNIALANELAIICESMQVDVLEAIKATNHKYPRTHLLMPGIGVGGSCLTKDPYIFAQPYGDKNGRPSVIYQARQLNDSMPWHFIDIIKDAFSEMNKKVAGSNVAVLGYAMKSGTDDTRKTPVKQIVEWLKQEDCRVRLYDPFVGSQTIQRELGIQSVNSLADAIHGGDAICLTTDHEEFLNLDLSWLKGCCRQPCAIIDGRHVVDPARAVSQGFIFRGVGRRHQFPRQKR